ncbi:crotonase/enoyl-CoA hydratase family protein [Corynebacterium sp. TAE3-ERU12]|uniref:crotonase/enoyl-CoA hydratase family protein n=1 Tax=Corynebacterium sp. TAE3-ERU12 TaxID=2849491 RepID=UPI001C4935A7|nr:crotonase/enoyl-CoA hydratase family protein [Corynebacterium sp. TAE3-ERU12]MBV7296096.1 crotonase/enoyl-CoA hydratase family protein [Corynebacterium sp. TAE3-ERU12]
MPNNSGTVRLSWECIDGARIAVVTLSRPDKLNALTLTMLRQLSDISRTLKQDREVRAVIIEGDGPSFCAGLDFGKALSHPTEAFRGFIPGWDGVNIFQRACWGWRRVPVPVIAAVQGHCYGGGLQIALGADIRVTAPDAKWSVLEGRWGIIPDMSGMRLITDAVGPGQTTWLAMSAEEVSGDRAAEIGLATHRAEDADSVSARARELAVQLAQRSPDQLAGVKTLMRNAHRSPLATFRQERLVQVGLLLRENTGRAQRATLNKVAPVFAPRATWSARLTGRKKSAKK